MPVTSESLEQTFRERHSDLFVEHQREVLELLESAGILAGVRVPRADPRATAERLAAVCVEYLWELERRQCREDLKRRENGARAHARALGRWEPRRKALLDEANGCGRGADLAWPSSRTLARQRSILDRLTFDLVLVLRRHAGVTYTRAVCMLVPAILKVLHDRYPDVMPRRGHVNPEARMKRFVRRTLKKLRADDPTWNQRRLFEARARVLGTNPAP